MKRVYVSMVIFLMITTVATSTTRRQRWTTPGYPGQNLRGKMFTLSRNGGGIRFFPSSFSMSATMLTPITSTGEKGFPTHKPIPTPRPTHAWPTPTPSSTGVSVCLRFISDSYLSDNFPLFTLSPSRSPLQVDVSITGMFRLSFDPWGQKNIFLRPTLRYWWGLLPNIWTSICITVDPLKNVAQMFSGPNMSIRKLMGGQYTWSGEPVVYVSGFDGQLTDLQVWDYPLHYREIYSYMEPYGYQGSVLTWSRIGYGPEGNVLLEDTFELQGKQPIKRMGRGQRGRMFSPRKERKRHQL